jgi:signal transduction histidine kinase
MKRKKQKQTYVTDKMIGFSILAGAILLTSVFTLCTIRERREGNSTIQSTLEFMRQQCIRYDNLKASEETAAQIQLLDKTKELERCLEEKENPTDTSFLEMYAKEQRLSGIILVNTELQQEASVCLEETDSASWQEVISDSNVVDVMEYPQKSYLARIRQGNGNTYDYVAVAMPEGQGVLLCYVRQIEDEADETTIGMENLFTGYSIEMDGLILITDGEMVLSSNEEEAQGQSVEEYSLLAEHKKEISSDKMGTIRQDGTTYLARSSKCKDYYLYVFFPAKAVFRQRSSIMSYVIILYILFLLVIVAIRQQEMSRSDQLKMKFLRQMSHDIRTPINGIRGMVRIGNSFPEDIEKQKECRDKIWEASELLMDIVNDVLDMGKLEAGELQMEEKPFDLKEMLESIVAIMAPQASEHGILIGIEQMEGSNWKLIGSPVDVRRILNNIIGNAVKYNQENGTVSISCRETERRTEDDKVIYEIVCSDTGIGMSREFQKRMFEQFTQENAADEQTHHGAGLGLPIVQSLVEEMHGTIRCTSKRGEGTTFYIELPFAIDTSAEVLPDEIKEKEEAERDVAKEDTTESDADNLQGISVLLVEDNELNMEIAEFILEDAGATITKAWNGREAVELFEQSKPGEIQVILMDMMMPVMDGETATRTIRKLGREDAATIPIIAMTANIFEEDVKAALDAGMNAHLAKPVDEKRMREVIREQVGRRAQA